MTERAPAIRDLLATIGMLLVEELRGGGKLSINAMTLVMEIAADAATVRDALRHALKSGKTPHVRDR